MITEQQIEIAKTLFETKLFSKVYHSVELFLNENNQHFPVYRIGNEQYYIGPDDTKDRFAYIRTAGPVGFNLDSAGCDKSYIYKAPARIVLFRAYEEVNVDLLIEQVLQKLLIPHVTIKSYNSSVKGMAKQESSFGNYAFDPTTLFTGVDITLSGTLMKNNCPQDLCKEFPNPIC